MKSIFHKISSVLLAVIVLFSTMSFSLNLHFCGNKMVETSMFHTTEGCGMEMENPATNSCSSEKDNCCDDTQISVEGQDDLQFSIDKISLDQQIFIASFIYTYFQLFEGFENDNPSFEEYAPPLVVKPIFKLDETYLI